jgi:hypothetical protein
MDRDNPSRHRSRHVRAHHKTLKCFADFTLRIKCRKCGHERFTDPHAPAKLLGWETPITTVAARLRCSKCQARGECELTVGNQGKRACIVSSA